MTYLRPVDVAELVQMRRDHPDWLMVAGGTDVMVPINHGHSRPSGVLDLSQVAELRACSVTDEQVHLGAAVTFSRIERELATAAPALAAAARTVGSPLVRATATIGGNLGTASPAGDALPVLVATEAEIDIASVRGRRTVLAVDFFVGPGRNVLARDEVITGVRLPSAGETSQEFSKVGVRNAMVISVASVALVIDWRRHRVGVGLGSVGPVPLRAPAAEALLAGQLWDEPAVPGLSQREIDIGAFAEAVAASASPIDDLRATARYRRHVIAVMAARTARWAIKGGMTR